MASLESALWKLNHPFDPSLSLMFCFIYRAVLKGKNMIKGKKKASSTGKELGIKSLCLAANDLSHTDCF